MAFALGLIVFIDVVVVLFGAELVLLTAAIADGTGGFTAMTARLLVFVRGEMLSAILTRTAKAASSRRESRCENTGKYLE